MAKGRSKCVIKGAAVMPHDEFIDRIRKSLYFGGQTRAEDMEVSRPLAEYASELFSEPHKGHSLNRLNSVAAGNVHATPCSLIMALIYLDRLNVNDPGYVRRITPQELFIVSMMISTKFYAGHDEEIYLSDWAEDGNMTEKRLKQLELEFLCAIDWNIYISNEQFFSKLSSIEKDLARREGLRRGWLTYGELMQMLPSFTLAKFLLNNITVMAVSYAASVMTIAGAFFLASQIPGNALHRKAMPAPEMEETLMPSPQPENATLTTDVATKQHHQQQQQQRLNATTSGTALNVEAELLKLERQYREEAALADLRRRYNEIATDSRLTLPDAATVQKLNGRRKASESAKRWALDIQRNWLALKQEYSDYHELSQKESFLASLQQTTQPCLVAGGGGAAIGDNDCFQKTLNNYTSVSLFWNLMADAAANAPFVRLPFLWFKFM